MPIHLIGLPLHSVLLSIDVVIIVVLTLFGISHYLCFPSTAETNRLISIFGILIVFELNILPFEVGVGLDMAVGGRDNGCVEWGGEGQSK